LRIAQRSRDDGVPGARARLEDEEQFIATANLMSKANGAAAAESSTKRRS
jgi:hypothetical protein